MIKFLHLHLGKASIRLVLYYDVDAECRCFSTIFLYYFGRSVPVKKKEPFMCIIVTFVKWELRSADRRAAQSVKKNIF